MDKELRIIGNRGHFPVPKFTKFKIHTMKIETTKDKDRVLQAVDTEVEDMLTAVKRSEEIYEREREEARKKEEQLKLTRQTNRSDFNFLTMANSTPIKDNNARTDQLAVHFNTNAIHHYYPPTNPTNVSDHYEPPANDSIIQGATIAPGDQLATNANQRNQCERS